MAEAALVVARLFENLGIGLAVFVSLGALVDAAIEALRRRIRVPLAIVRCPECGAPEGSDCDPRCSGWWSDTGP